MKNKVKEWIELAGIDLAAARKLSGDEYLRFAEEVFSNIHQILDK